MSIYALLNSLMSTFDDYNSINIYRAILDSEQIVLLKKKSKRKFKKLRKVPTFTYISRPRRRTLCRSPTISPK